MKSNIGSRLNTNANSNINKSESIIRSFDQYPLHAVCWSPAGDGEQMPKGVLQITHGLGEYIDRYDEMANYFAAAGYIVVGADQRGHGDSGFQPGEPVSLPEGDFDTLVRDIAFLCNTWKQSYAGLPYYLLGVSMGSLIVRAYMNNSHAEMLDGVILASTFRLPPALVKALDRILAADGLMGRQDKATKLANFILLGIPRLRAESRKTKADWLYTDSIIGQAYLQDPRKGMDVTNRYARIMLQGMLKTAQVKRTEVNANMRVLLAFGEKDPLAEGQKGMDGTAEFFEDAEYPEVAMLEYMDKRHDFLKDDCREMVWSDILEWMEDLS